MTPDEYYQVVNSQAVAEQFRDLADEARASGHLPLFLAAARWILEELARTPTEFGESWTTWPGSDLIFRRGFAGPLFVQYAIREDERVVYIRRFALRHRP
jgi:hypothetical protein